MMACGSGLRHELSGTEERPVGGASLEKANGVVLSSLTTAVSPPYFGDEILEGWWWGGIGGSGGSWCLSDVNVRTLLQIMFEI